MEQTSFSPHRGLYIQHLKSSKKHDMTIQHYHDSYEIYLQLNGKRYLFCGDRCCTLERGDMAIFEPFVIHYAQSRDADEYERYVVNFRPSELLSVLSQGEADMLCKKLSTSVIHLDEDETVRLCGEFDRITHFESGRGFLAEKALSAALMQLILQAAACSEQKDGLSSRNADPNVVRAICYIDSHYREDLSLDKIAENVHMSKYYLCRTFHRVTGATMLEYLNNVRLSKAHSLLLNTDMRIEEIAEKTGFSSPMQFTRIFKKTHNAAPSVFRKIHGEKNDRT